MKQIIVADTSCLIILDKIGFLHILNDLFEEVIVTKEVKAEFGAELPDWIQEEEVANEKIKQVISLNLDIGEASSIALCLSKSEDTILIIDEKKGRKIAKDLGIKIIGTLGVILEASRQGFIIDLNSVVVRLEEYEFRLSPILKQQLLDTQK